MSHARGYSGDVWICGYSYAHTPYGMAWAFAGVFDTEQRAVEACKSPDHFVGPANLNERQPDGPSAWAGAYFPLREPLNS